MLIVQVNFCLNQPGLFGLFGSNLAPILRQLGWKKHRGQSFLSWHNICIFRLMKAHNGVGRNAP